MRVGDVVGGHVHPSLCVTQSGAVLAVYNEDGGGAAVLKICRSEDGGRTWSPPAPIPASANRSRRGVYPGSLSVLRTGRIVLQWAPYYELGEHQHGDPGHFAVAGDIGPGEVYRVPEYCVSDDDGNTFGPTVFQIGPHYNLTNYSELRFPLVEQEDGTWILPFYDRTVAYDPKTKTVLPFGDGRNHGMVPIVKTTSGALISGAPQEHSPIPVGKPDATGRMVEGLRSENNGHSWTALHQLSHFGVCGYDLTALDNGWVVHTAVIYGAGVDGEFAYELWTSRDDGRTFDRRNAVEIYNPGRRITGRGWPRTVQLDAETLGTLFYDLDETQDGGPGVFFVRTPISALG